MDTITRHHLEEIIAHGTKTYAAQAQEILANEHNWSEKDITDFIDGYFNDPYLVRNQ